MVTQFSVQLRCDQLRSSAFGTPDDGNCTCLSPCQPVNHMETDPAHTHRDAHAKQATDDLINYRVQILIARLRAVDLPIGIIPQPQAEEVRLRNDEIQILIVNLRDMPRSASRSYLACEIFK